MLVHYSSESRGYAPVCCFALLAYLAVDRGLRRPGSGIAALCWLLALLGVLSHSTFAFAWFGLVAWSLAAFFDGRTGVRPRTLLLLHGVPAVTLAAVWFFRIRGMVSGGGPVFDLDRVLVDRVPTSCARHMPCSPWSTATRSETRPVDALTVS